MNGSKQVTLERRKLRELIREYSKLGYRVYAESKGCPKPGKIGDFTPDLILRKGNQTIIVEIATSRDLKSLGKKFEQLARYAEDHENVRFDIVLTNPKPKLSREEKRLSKEILLDDIQKRVLRDTKELYEMGYNEASLLMLSVLLENVLREFAIKKRAIGIGERMPTMKLASLLRGRGIISKSNFISVERVTDLRNRVIHESYRPDKQALREMLDFVSYFAKRVG